MCWSNLQLISVEEGEGALKRKKTGLDQNKMKGKHGQTCCMAKHQRRITIFISHFLKWSIRVVQYAGFWSKRFQILIISNFLRLIKLRENLEKRKGLKKRKRKIYQIKLVLKNLSKFSRFMLDHSPTFCRRKNRQNEAHIEGYQSKFIQPMIKKS